MPGIRSVAAAMVVLGGWANVALGETDHVQPEPGGSSAATSAAVQSRAADVKIYVHGIATSAKFEFYPLQSYEPATHRNISTGGASYQRLLPALERKISGDLQGGVEKINAAVLEGVRASMEKAGMVGAIQPVPAFRIAAPPAMGAPSRVDMGAHLAQLPYMQKRGVPVAVVFAPPTLSTVYEGDLVNPQPVVKADGAFSIFSQMANIGRTVTGNEQPMTFDGVAKLTWQAEYKVYDVGTGQELRSGAIGPFTVVTERWQGAWRMPPQIARPTLEEAMQHITDPRGTVLAAALEHLAAKASEAVSASFNDWVDLLQASQELAARK